MDIGYVLSSEEHGPRDLTRQAQEAEQSGFESVAISDHFHPWLDEQGQSPFVWSVIGAVAATTQLRITTGVTCPTMRIHPAIIAQAAATSAALMPGRFRLGVGTGENLNEHILGDAWPPVRIRLEMLEEAVALVRELWKGDAVTHRGRHYTVWNARIYTRPDEPPPILMSGFGAKSIEVAARIADGLISTRPDPGAVGMYSEAGGRGPKVAVMKCCWAQSADEGRRTAHRLWRHTVVPGQLAQELAMPEHFEQVSEMITVDEVGQSFPCGPDPQPYIETIAKYRDAGFDELDINQIGTDQAGFLRFFQAEIRPRLETEITGAPQRHSLAPAGGRRHEGS